MNRLLALCAALTLAGCRCPPGGTGQVDPGFRVVTEGLDFGRVLEGERVRLPVTLQNTTRLDLVVEAQLAQPFTVPLTIALPGGSEESFDVEFHAGDGVVEATLTLSANGGAAELNVRGEGVRPPNCPPSGPCRDTHYSLETDRCEEGPSPEGSACQTESLCLEKGECRAGLCVGVARSCDDNDACTVDACAPTSGCVHSQKSCPSPANPCRVPSCDPTSGCGEGVAPDFTQCGPFTCVQGDFCISGNCMQAQTPEGFTCANATPCQGKGVCTSQVCVRPDAGILTPELVVPLSGQAPAEGPQLVSAQGNVYTVLCGPFALGDGGIDGGTDAGECLLASWTGSGIDRYRRPTADGGERFLAGVSSSRVVLSSSDSVEALAASSGAALSSESFSGGTCGPSGAAQDGAGELWVLTHDGGAATLARLPGLDGGGRLETALPAPAELLAIDEQGQLWAFAPRRAWLGRLALQDGGLGLVEVLDLADAGSAALSTAKGTVAFGARWLARPTPDGGHTISEWPAFSDAGQPLAWAARDTLLSFDMGAALYRRCEAPFTSCADFDQGTFVALFDSATGAHRWSAQVLPASVEATVVEYAVGRAAVTVPPITVDFVAAAVRVDFDAGTQSYLEVFADGERTVICPFPDGTHLEAATWGDGYMYTLAHAKDGGFRFESWDMKGAPLSNTGWPKTNSVSGTRAAR